jgi:L-threonylcarbamoyladenylate synthase
MIVPDTEETRDLAAKLVTNGGVIAFRTDTFYGLGVDPLNADAVARVRALKKRENDKPILLLIADAEDLDRFVVEKSEDFEVVTRSIWPGPLTVIGRAAKSLPEALTAGTGTVGVRLPDYDNVRALVRLCGGALTATSANLSGSPSASVAQEVVDYFPTGIDLIVDGGEVSATQPSTILDLSGADPRVIRDGAVSRKTLEGVLGLAL